MHRRSACIGLILATLFAPSFAHAADRATPEEAKALAEKAAAHLAQVGPQKAIADFMDPAAGFVDVSCSSSSTAPTTRSSAATACPC
jgi:hypothetical protein